jgi:hypothetical protein
MINHNRVRITTATVELQGLASTAIFLHQSRTLDKLVTMKISPVINQLTT